MVVLDTSTLLFWTLDQAKLSAQAKAVLSRAEHTVISAISIWEIGIKVKRDKLKIPLSLHDYVAKLNAIDGFEILSVDTAIWLRNLELDWDHKDPADRTIVATADLLESTLITSDHAIRAFYKQAIW